MTNIRRLQDVQIGTEELINTYRNYFANRYIDAAHNLINTNTLKSYVLQAEWMNSVKTKIEDLEQPKDTEIDQDLKNKNIEFQYNVDELLYLNEYNGNVQYYKNNFVLYNNRVYFCIQNSLGNLPTNTSYWLNVGLIGEKGQYGLGVTYKGFWNENTLYNKYDLVSYQNNLYIAINDNSGNAPSQYEKYLNNNLYLNDGLYLGYTESNQYWFLLTRVQPQPIYIFPLDYTQLPSYSIFLKELSHSIPSTPVSVSGSIISINNALSSPVVDLTVGIEPVQDLHGYDNPWPAGGGKNLINYVESEKGGIDASGTLINGNFWRSTVFSPCLPSQNYTMSVKSDTSQVWTVRLYFYDAEYNFIAPRYEGHTIVTGISPANAVYFKWSLYHGEILITLDDVASANIQVELGSSATTFAPYSNICPISGWTGMNVQRTGKNWANITDFTATSSARICNTNGVSVNAGTYTVSFDFTSTASDKRVQAIITSNSTVTQGTSDPSNIIVREYIQAVSESRNTITITTTQAGYFYLRIVSEGGTTSNVQLELGSTATSYEPYQGTTYPISWSTQAGTVYGGSLDVTTGVLTVDRANVDLGTLTWSYDTTSGHERFKCNDLKSLIKAPSGVTILAEILCSYYKTISAESSYQHNNGIGIAITTNGTMYVYDNNYNDTTAFTSVMSGVQLVYELATPITYQLTPTEVTTLLGVNNVWADTGDIQMTYKANINS